MKEHQEKSVIITGAGSGMGRAMALRFAAEGARVLASDVRADRLDVLFEEVKKSGGVLNVFKADVSNEAEAGAMVLQCAEKYGTVDVLVNNAGILDDFTPVPETTTTLWNRVMGVNVNGPFFACREAIPLMLRNGKGAIINIASIGGFCGSRAGAAYTASKHALIGLTRNIGYQYATLGVRCNAIAPGGVNTNIGENMHPNAFGYQKLSLGMQTNPRMAEPAEIAEVALFLASDRASFINGAVITADGGWTAY